MIRAVMGLVLLLLITFVFFAVACDGGGSAALPSASRPTGAPTPVVAVPSASETPPTATTPPPVAEPPTPERPSTVRVTGSVLATSWPAYLGRRVSFPCRMARRIDFTRTIVIADGATFVVVSGVEAAPCAKHPSTFTVLGSTVAPLLGRTALPELLLEDGDEE